MVTDLSAMFVERRTNVIEFEGVPTYGLFEFAEVPSQVQVTFVAASGDPVQGVQFRMRGGTLVVNGGEASDVVVWCDSAPESVVVEVRAGGRGRPGLKLWNVWRGGLGVTQAWLGNAAMRIEGDPRGSCFRLRCSDGQGEPDFDDLVVEVRTR